MNVQQKGKRSSINDVRKNTVKIDPLPLVRFCPHWVIPPLRADILTDDPKQQRTLQLKINIATLDVGIFCTNKGDCTRHLPYENSSPVGDIYG